MQRHLLCLIRGGGFDADLDYAYYRKLLLRWRHENGLYMGMSVRNHGHTGHWTEALGVTAPLQDMLLQSWDGAIAVFPCWPLDVPAAFADFRAEGAFLVSAACGEGRIHGVAIQSLAGGPCSVYPPWPAFGVRSGGSPVELGADDVGRPCFETQKGRTYELFNITEKRGQENA